MKKRLAVVETVRRGGEKRIQLDDITGWMLKQEGSYFFRRLLAAPSSRGMPWGKAHRANDNGRLVLQMVGQKERVSAIVSAGGKVHAFDGHRIAAFCFVDMGDARGTTKMVALIDGELTDADIYMILEQVYIRVGLDRFVVAANELALHISKDERAGGATA